MWLLEAGGVLWSAGLLFDRVRGSALASEALAAIRVMHGCFAGVLESMMVLFIRVGMVVGLKA